MITFIILRIDGNINNTNISSRLKNIELNLEKKVTVKGTDKISMVGKWIVDDCEIVIFGWNKGNKKNENKHSLPPPYDDNIFFGDICCCKFKDDKMINFKIDDYEKFYNTSFFEFNDSVSDNNSDNDISDGYLSVDSELMKEDYSDSE